MINTEQTTSHALLALLLLCCLQPNLPLKRIVTHLKMLRTLNNVHYLDYSA